MRAAAARAWFSMPCAEIFDAQDAAWKESVLPSTDALPSGCEAASPDYWHKYVGLDGAVLGIQLQRRAPGSVMFERFGFTTANVLEKARDLLK